jgi:periplasmic divalent cation tolerance protein
VAAHLVACVNIVPGLRSVYWWKGQVCRDDELLLVMKTRADLVPAVSEKIKALHPYEVPEFIALPLEGGSAAYLRWILDATDRPTA